MAKTITVTFWHYTDSKGNLVQMRRTVTSQNRTQHRHSNEPESPIQKKEQQICEIEKRCPLQTLSPQDRKENCCPLLLRRSHQIDE